MGRGHMKNTVNIHIYTHTYTYTRVLIYVKSIMFRSEYIILSAKLAAVKIKVSDRVIDG